VNRLRLIERIPRIYVGPGAARVLEGERGVLLGAKRPEWVDVLELEARGELRLEKLVALRFAAFPPWEVVGLSLLAPELVEWRDRLLRDLVPGDVLITEKGPSVHRGDGWAEAKLVRR